MNTGGDKGNDSSTHPSDIAILKDVQGFAALEEEWEDLYHDSPRATPFQSWAWLYSWWEFYGEDYELRLVTVPWVDIRLGTSSVKIVRYGPSAQPISG
jgi:CelD/BcsL family acetyltransferase involved in cellulose biosynthesis